MKALVLVSGGLDSSLAVRILQEQNIGIEAVHFTGVFHSGRRDEYNSYVKCFTDTFHVPLTTFQIQDDFLDIIKNPRYGYGRNINPCIDCRIYTLKRAKAYMEEAGASFVATGEVLGQRPMSQRKNMIEVVAKRSGLERLLLRPLSAKLLEPTIPEEMGWVDREMLYDISGRSRKPQMELAKRFGIEKYPAPAGGCLLTDPQFTARVKDLIEHNSLTLYDMELLKVGRHFRLSDNTKAIVGRHRDDNERIIELVKKGDTMLKVKDTPGPITLLKGNPTAKDVEMAAGITARYSKAKERQKVDVIRCTAETEGKDAFNLSDTQTSSTLSVKPAAEEMTSDYVV